MKSVLTKLYSSAIQLLYPKKFRQQYKKQMTQTYKDMLTDSNNKIQKLLVSFTVFAEMPINSYSERLKSRGAKLHQNTAKSFRKLAIVCMVILLLLLVIPLSMALKPNSELLHSAVASDIQVLSFFVLPALAVLILLNSLFAWSTYKANRYSEKTLSYLKDIRRIWPVYAALSLSMLVVGLALFGTYQSLSDEAVIMSTKLQQEKPSQACSALTLESAKKFIGSDITMNNARMKDKNAEPTYDGILFEDNDLLVSSCTYVPKRQTPVGDPSLIVGVRESKKDSAKKDQQEAFFTNIVGGEVAISVEDHKGFYMSNDNTVELRLWANERWIEVHAPSLEVAIPVAKEMIQNI